MKLVVTSTVAKNEYQEVSDVFSLEVLKLSARKALQGLGEKIKSTSKIPGTFLKKLYLTSSGGAGRVVFLLELSNNKSVLVMIRLKNDKQVGSNMTVKNAKFTKALEKNLESIVNDIKNGDYQEFDL